VIGRASATYPDSLRRRAILTSSAPEGARVAKRQRVTVSASLPAPVRDAALRYATDLDTDDLALRESFGIARAGDEAHHRAVWLCVLAARKVIYGWAALECEGDAPAQAVEATARWVQSGVAPDWGRLSLAAPAIRGGRVIGDCDACRAEPIAAAAAHTVRFAHTADAAEVLFMVWCAIDEGVHGEGAMPFERWVAMVALPAAFELRSLSERELRA
jgi:hypothetical protein